jgi:chromate transporter
LDGASNPGSDHSSLSASKGSLVEVFLVFLKLGLTSFGGPIAHLGYFRNELVERRKWLSEGSYGELITLCQFLPGPASSQVGFSLGILRGRGIFGGLAAWLGFTMPSALLMLAFALWASAISGPVEQGFLHGLKLVAVAVVGQAVWGMARTLTPDRERAGIALTAVLIVIALPGSAGQIAAIGFGAVAGLRFCNAAAPATASPLRFPVARRGGVVALCLFAVLLLLPPIFAAHGARAIGFFDAFYRSGALVFGGGHVVLPLLQAAVVKPGWVTSSAFIAGYGAAQAVPGPLFTFAAYLGAAAMPGPAAVAAAALALVAIFLPGLLLVYGMLPFWASLRTRPLAQAAMRGANAGVVGILVLALYNPVWTSAILTRADFALALAGFLSLTVWKSPPWLVVMLLALAGVVPRILGGI